MRTTLRLALLMLALACSVSACAEDNNGSATGATYVESDSDTDADGAGERAPIAPGPNGPTTTAGEAASAASPVVEPHDGDSSGGAAIGLNRYTTPTAGSGERSAPVIEESAGITQTDQLATPTPTAGE